MLSIKKTIYSSRIYNITIYNNQKKTFSKAGKCLINKFKKGNFATVSAMPPMVY